MDMTDDEFRLYQARQNAAAGYRAEGFEQYADEVERGEHDECQLMRWEQLWLQPPQPHSEAFVAGVGRVRG
jgi:hypothetical protein